MHLIRERCERYESCSTSRFGTHRRFGSHFFSLDEAEEGDVLLKEKDSRTQGKSLFCSRRAYHN